MSQAGIKKKPHKKGNPHGKKAGNPHCMTGSDKPAHHRNKVDM